MCEINYCDILILLNHFFSTGKHYTCWSHWHWQHWADWSTSLTARLHRPAFISPAACLSLTYPNHSLDLEFSFKSFSGACLTNFFLFCFLISWAMCCWSDLWYFNNFIFHYLINIELWQIEFATILAKSLLQGPTKEFPLGNHSFRPYLIPLRSNSS